MPSARDDGGADAARADVDDEHAVVGAHGQGSAPNGAGQAELARVEDAVRVERVLHRLQHAEARAERVGDEAGPVQADAVVVAERAAVLEDAALSRVPRGAVVRLALGRRAGGPRT